MIFIILISIDNGTGDLSLYQFISLSFLLVEGHLLLLYKSCDTLQKTAVLGVRDVTITIITVAIMQGERKTILGSSLMFLKLLECMSKVEELQKARMLREQWVNKLAKPLIGFHCSWIFGFCGRAGHCTLLPQRLLFLSLTAELGSLVFQCSGREVELSVPWHNASMCVSCLTAPDLKCFCYM